MKALEHFGCKTEFREAGLALVGLSAPESDLSDVGGLVSELFVEAACVTFTFHTDTCYITSKKAVLTLQVLRYSLNTAAM